MRKNILLLLLFIIFAVFFSGCGAADFVSSDIIKAFEERTTENIAQLDLLKNAGFITQEERDKWAEDIKKHTKAYTGAEVNDANMKRLLRAVTYIDNQHVSDSNDYGLEWTDNTYMGVSKGDWKDSYLPAAVYSRGFESNVLTLSGKDPEPIAIVDTQTASDINERFKLPIYVLKSETDLNNVDNYQGLDGIIEMVKQATADPNKIDESILANYFQDSGMTLFDMASGSDDLDLIRETTYNDNAGSNGLGKDIAFNQYGLKALSVRVIEFNPDVMDVLTRIAGSGSDKYIFTNGKLYLMEYPVFYVSMLERVSDTEYNTILSRSSLYINLKTQSMAQVTAQGTKKIDLTDSYLSFSGALNNDAASQSSFIVWGTDYNLDVSLNFRGGSGNIDMAQFNKLETLDNGYARIVLRDYLEASYAPGLVDNENLVVFGRKLRINQFADTNGTKAPDGTQANVDSHGCYMDEPFAYYVDKDGKKLEDLTNLYVDDIGDYAGLTSYGTEPRVYYIQRGNLNKDAEGQTPLDASELDEGVRTSLTALSELGWESRDKISVGIKFPGASIGKVDNYLDSKPIFYAIPVVKSFFETSLYSGWIANTSNNQSLNWWNTWLTSRGYSYQILTSVLEEWLLGNYTFELNQQGIIILDLDTIAKIQEEYELEDDISNNKITRSIFVTGGWLLIALSVIYLAAWAIDVNVDLGFNVLEKMSFGHWVAVGSSDEMPVNDGNGVSYLTFPNLLLRCGIMILTGVILIFVPVTNIAVKFIEIFGGLAQIIESLISGN